MNLKAAWRLLRGAKGVVKGLDPAEVLPDPLDQFKLWYREAERAGLFLPEAVCLSTASPDGAPSARMMLLKGVDERGFRIFTNFESRKAEEFLANPRAALVFHWNEIQRQVRVEGVIRRIDREESEAYFRSRSRGSQIGAWASRQSARLDSRRQLEEQVEDTQLKFKDGEVPLPPFWGGFLVEPTRIEFWQGRADRLHDRVLYERDGQGWRTARLSP